MVYDGLPWTMDYHALFGITLSWIIVGYLTFFAVSWMMDYRGIPWITVDYGLSWTIWDCRGLLWII